MQTTFEPGKAIIHTGNVPHATHPITSGQRSNLVVWLYGDRMQIPRGGASSYGSVDNSGAKEVQCLKILGESNKKYGFVGDTIIVSLKNARRATMAVIATKKILSKLIQSCALRM